MSNNQYTTAYTGLRAAAWTLTRTSLGLSFDGTGISSNTRALDGLPQWTTVHARCDPGIDRLSITVVGYRNKK